MAVDFKRIFDIHHIPTRNTSRNWVNINCPFCKNPIDTHFNGGFNVLSPRYNCWRCGEHSWYDAFSKLLFIPPQNVSEYVKPFQFISKDTDKKVAKAEHLDLPGYTLNEEESQYLRNRGFDVQYLKSRFKIRGGGKYGDWSYRIIIPIYYKRVLVSWTGRSILTREQIKEYNIPRYKNLSIEQSVINPKSIFFNIDNSKNDSVMLVEGPMDVMKMGSDCICSLGTSMTREQELFLKQNYKTIFICFDNEPAAQEKAKKVGTNLASIGLNIEVVNICEPFVKEEIFDEEKQEWIKIYKNDPGELSYDEVAEIRKELGFYN